MKKSVFTNVVEAGGCFYLHNTLYNTAIKVYDSSFQKALAPLSAKSVMSLDDQKFYDDLVKTKMLVEDDVDELNIVNMRFRNYCEMVLNKHLYLLMIPHRGCNFRCPYCYEDHNNQIMPDIVYKKTIAYIKHLIKTKGYKVVTISWFGGEPMLAYDKICAFMAELETEIPSEVIVKGQMTTNGYLLTPDKLRTLVNLGINDYQITIDGLADTHNATRYLVGGGGTWHTIIENLISAKKSELDFKITIRTNLSQKLAAHPHEWFKFLAETFAADRRFVYHFETIKDLGGDDTSHMYNHDAEHQKDPTIEVLRIAKQFSLPIDGFSRKLTNFSLLCYAANPNSMLIDHNGLVKKCTVALDDEKQSHNVVGNLLTGEIDENKFSWWTDYDLKPQCKECGILPICFGRKCPNSYFSQQSCDHLMSIYKGIVVNTL